MFSATATYRDFLITVYSAEGSQHPNQDRWLIHPRGESLRVAVIDGVTPWRTEKVPGGDAGQFAAATVSSYLSLPLSIEEAFRASNRALHNPLLRPRARQTMAAAAAADITLKMGRLDCSGLVAADCEWWGTDNGNPAMRLFIGGEARTAEAIEKAQARAVLFPPEDGEDARREREAEDFAELSAFHRHAIGLCDEPKFTAGEGRFDTIVLASDGALLTEAPQVSADPQILWSWLDHVENKTPRDDFTIVTVTAA